MSDAKDTAYPPATVTLCVWREAGMWVGQAADFDIGAQADTLEELVRRFELAASIELYMADGCPPQRSDPTGGGRYHMTINVQVTPTAPPPMRITP